ncbi:MAG: hemolysin family protein [Thermodesulfobacteriota bacterium]|nr:hemolysin family protein [Thermodesulfobacteriota bacterium]
MEFTIIIKICIIFFLLIFSGFFSGSETALFSLSLMQRERIRRSKNKKAAVIDRLLMHPKQLIITILMGNDLVNIAASVVATYLFISILGEHGKWAAIVILTPLTLLFAEVIPKTFSVAHNERVAPFVSGPLYLFSKLITPLRWIFNESANLIIKFSGFEKQKPPSAIMEDDFRDMVDLSHRGGELKKMEKELIHNVFEFSDTHLFEAMTPVEKMFCLTEDMDIDTILKHIKKTPFSRIPVCKETADKITGILYVKDLLKVKSKKISGQTKLLPKICRKPFFIPETKMVDELFYILKQKHTHIAICLNDQGMVSGLVTMEDLLEELFGEIYDEHDMGEAR